MGVHEDSYWRLDKRSEAKEIVRRRFYYVEGMNRERSPVERRVFRGHRRTQVGGVYTWRRTEKQHQALDPSGATRGAVE